MNNFALLRAALAYIVSDVVADCIADGWAIDVPPTYEDQAATTTRAIRRSTAEMMRERSFDLFELSDFPAGYDL